MSVPRVPRKVWGCKEEKHSRQLLEMVHTGNINILLGKVQVPRTTRKEELKYFLQMWDRQIAPQKPRDSCLWHPCPYLRRCPQEEHTGNLVNDLLSVRHKGLSCCPRTHYSPGTQRGRVGPHGCSSLSHHATQTVPLPSVLRHGQNREQGSRGMNGKHS